jgi:hypothetical protein
MGLHYASAHRLQETRLDKLPTQNYVDTYPVSNSLTLGYPGGQRVRTRPLLSTTNSTICPGHAVAGCSATV